MQLQNHIAGFVGALRHMTPGIDVGNPVYSVQSSSEITITRGIPTRVFIKEERSDQWVETYIVFP